MKFQVKIGERGQIVIPKPIRDNLGLGKNTALEVEQKGTTVTLTFSREREMRNLDLAMKKYGGSLRKQFLADGYTSVDQYLDEIGGFDETRRK